MLNPFLGCLFSTALSDLIVAETVDMSLTKYIPLNNAKPLNYENSFYLKGIKTGKLVRTQNFPKN